MKKKESPRKNKVKPTALQKKALAIMKENPNMPLGEVMITAGYAEKSAEKPKQNLTDTRGFEVAAEQYQEILHEKGITLDKLAEKQKEWLDAGTKRTYKVKDKKGKEKIIETFDPDYGTQLKAGEMLREDLGIKQNGAQAPSYTFMQFISRQKQKYDI